MSAEPIATNPATPSAGSDGLPEVAFHGIAGAVVRALEPHTEADPAGLLLTFLAAAGAALGPYPHAVADGSEHPARLNVVLVGSSARARKGTSWAVVRRVLTRADPAFFADHVLGGLSSGEGLVAALAKGNDGPDPTTAGWLLVHEPEFARLLKVASRSASLSAIIREAWDSGELSVVTRREPLRASGAHVSVLGHITGEELVRSLRAVEIANGMANRFLFVGVHRSKRLPFGGQLSEATLDDLARSVSIALQRGRQLGRLERSPAAREYWARLYASLDDDVVGVVGSLTARAEAQILRLSVTFAVLDGSPLIELQHLIAAEAIWRYCEASVVNLFAENPLTDLVGQRLLAALKNAPDGLDGTQQRRLLPRHIRLSVFSTVSVHLELQRERDRIPPGQHFRAGRARLRARSSATSNRCLLRSAGCRNAGHLQRPRVERWHEPRRASRTSCGTRGSRGTTHRPSARISAGSARA
jgi:hypothetical protein